MRQLLVLSTIVCPLLLARAAAQDPTEPWVVLYEFGPANQAVTTPTATLVETSPGVFVGSYQEGLFQISSAGAFSVLSSFSSTKFPFAQGGAITPANNGYFYGVTSSGDNTSLIYRMSASGEKTALNDSIVSAGPLTEASDGFLWGTQGSASAGYSAFKISLAGALTTVAQGLSGVTEGPLFQASDGNFYGGTLAPSSTVGGVIYRLTHSGAYTVLYTFPPGEGSKGGLIQGSNGLLYGTSVYSTAACPSSVGGVFAVSLAGSFRSLLEFPDCYGQLIMGPLAGLLEASDGVLYGSTIGQGSYSMGTIFAIDLNGVSFHTLLQFDGGDGADPNTPGAALTQGSDGSLYGVTAGGGSGEGGTVFQLNLGLMPPLPGVRLIQPNSGAPGTTVRLTGNYLLGLTGVSFNGTPATFTPINVNYANAVVPNGATTGPITVTTMNGSFTTKTSFTVN